MISERPSPQLLQFGFLAMLNALPVASHLERLDAVRAGGWSGLRERFGGCHLDPRAAIPDARRTSVALPSGSVSSILSPSEPSDEEADGVRARDAHR